MQTTCLFLTCRFVSGRACYFFASDFGAFDFVFCENGCVAYEEGRLIEKLVRYNGVNILMCVSVFHALIHR